MSREVQEATNRASAMEASVQRETEVNAALEEHRILSFSSL